jgi:hypothetical protein
MLLLEISIESPRLPEILLQWLCFNKRKNRGQGRIAGRIAGRTSTISSLATIVK